MNNIKTYLFDFDGTLVDSMPTYVSAMLRILDENSIYSFGGYRYFDINYETLFLAGDNSIPDLVCCFLCCC